jgi:CHAT domain-containing protein
VILSPDGDLNFVSFVTLMAPDGEFLAEKYSLRYVASGRDLLREINLSTAKGLVAFGNPDFGGEIKLAANRSVDEAASPLRTLELRDFGGVSLPPLPGTGAECSALKNQVARSGTKAQVFLGAEATEAQLRQVESPRILHLATHGFFLPEDMAQADRDPNRTGMDFVSIGAETHPRHVLLKNPMHRSGLALAGAQRTLDAWAKGEVPPTENDGVVTAEEVGGLKLQGTWLVTLSACDTGSGEARAGEGVLGLRRGFIEAGAQNLLMTLWTISDATTVKIMKDFYARALQSGNAPQALADTQREWLVKLREQRGLLDAVELAGPFIMSSQGKP